MNFGLLSLIGGLIIMSLSMGGMAITSNNITIGLLLVPLFSGIFLVITSGFRDWDKKESEVKK